MKRDRVVAIIICILSTLCIWGAAIAAETTKPVVQTEGHLLQSRSSGFRRIGFTDSRGHAMAVSDADEKAAGLASPGDHIRSGGRETVKVLTVLGQRISDPQLIEKVRYKLSTMSENRLRLAVSLSERAAGDAPGVETEIAFFLLTTLIIFS